MYAIVEIAGQQFKVEKDQKLYVHRLDAERGSVVEFDKVLLVDNNGAITVGAPVVEGATVSANVVKNGKAKKIYVMKYKSKKNEKKKIGHRQPYTKVQIVKIEG